MSKQARRRLNAADSRTSDTDLKVIQTLDGPPNGFEKRRSEIWLYFERQVSKAGGIQQSKSVPLELLVDAYVQYEETSRILRVEGVYYTTSSSHTSGLKRKHPLVDVNSALRKQIIELLERLGICALTNASAENSGTSEVDAAAKYFSC
ncbi:MAG: P27 family phage terminase small subunit [Henriciella sp.]|nr:P27 family phage terminase small subunit [Henriciella sp.]MBO6694961.1 P27 family phage terminase small subunit [Henriciella sp.]